MVKYAAPLNEFAIESAKWEKVAKKLSALFSNYPDIYSSQVRIYFYQGDVYFTNSEGTETVQPLLLAAIQVNASTQAVDGEPLSDDVQYFSSDPQNLPAFKSVKQAVKKMADANVRSIIILDNNCDDYYILTADDAIEYKLQKISLQTKLRDIILKRVQTIDAKINLTRK